ncbi:galactosyltransferase Lgt5 [Moraxella sp. Pampa]|uniref:galactosyltransferase Lgt5 n=1 Tax=Moraxella sp. Pampa TaxID=3111978 RepID=UPI002B40A3D4|nr:galactosyltransferase Lgt5 [Moraxella sp. Pampa]
MSNNLSLPTIGALWIGGKLGTMASACLTSFLMRGHQVNLYTYGQLPDVPNGITVCDGNEIIHHSKIIKHEKTQSYALFSDIFRYELLHKKPKTIYVDCDVYCVQPISLPEHGYLFGYERDNLINGAILALPKDSATLQSLRNIIDTPNFTPEWYSPFRKFRLKIKRLFGSHQHISQMAWGVAGPSAITYYTNHHDVDHLAQPLDVLYPIQYDTVLKLLDPALTLDDIITERSVCVHLYNEVLRHQDLSHIDKNCVLAKMLDNQI